MRELLVGRSAQRQFHGLEVGSRVTLRGADWTVVGVFDSGGDRYESELITGAETLLSTFRRATFQSIAVQLDSADSFPAFSAALHQDPTLTVDVQRETDYAARQSQSFTQVLTIVASLIGGIMALGAVFGALNSMHSAVSARTVEIATLRVLGFASTPVVVSVFVEALLLAAVGGLAGAGLAWLIFDGHVVSTSGSGATQLAVPLVVSCFWWIAAPTREGRAILDRIAGFRQYLSITERERLDRMTAPEDTPEVFEKYLPYAIALGVENRWANRFASVLAAAQARGDQRQGFYWYAGSGSPWNNPTLFVNSVGASLASTISSASTAPGSSSGSGGGGFSGGGGGGGGGGGW